MNYSATGYPAYTATVGKKVQGSVEPGSDERFKVAESLITHPTHTDGLVDAGDACYVGGIVGVAQDSAAASTDEVTIDTCGVYCLNVLASDDAGTSAVAIGNLLYIGTDGVVSKKASGKAFGYAVSTLSASATAAACAVMLMPSVIVPNSFVLDPSSETLSVAGPTAAKTIGTTLLDGTTAAAAATLADGTTIGQLKFFRCTDSTNDPTLTVAHHVTSDPEVFTYGTAGMRTLLMWDGLDWVTLYNTATV